MDEQLNISGTKLRKEPIIYTDPKRAEYERKRKQLGAMVRSAYAQQKLRIQCGLRLCANFRSELGQADGDSEDELPLAAKELLKELRQSFRRLTDGIARNRTLPKRGEFKGDQLITDYTKLALTFQYLDMEYSETKQFGLLEGELEEFRIYNEFLKQIPLLGPVSAAIIISEFDIFEASTPSKLWAYAGLDVVTHWELQDVQNVVVNTGTKNPNIQFGREVPRLQTSEEQPYFTASDGSQRWITYLGKITPETHKGQAVLHARKDGWEFEALYKQVDIGGRSKKREHLVTRKYINKDGEEAEKLSITYNPFLKTKLVGVLANSFLRKGSLYRELYDSYHHRISNDPRKAEWTKSHRHRAAKRYMIKGFLIDLYRKWREVEGLYIRPSYAEEKLGMPPHS